jgi:HSP20 family protein
MARQIWHLSELAALEQQLNQIFEGMISGGAQSAWSPAVDIYETDANFVLTAEVPGVPSSEVDVKVVDHQLVLRGERRWEPDTNGEHFHRLESAYGKFERTFNLSERIDVGNISASLDKGVLTVVLPKRSHRGRQVKVETGGE